MLRYTDCNVFTSTFHYNSTRYSCLFCEKKKIDQHWFSLYLTILTNHFKTTSLSRARSLSLLSLFIALPSLFQLRWFLFLYHSLCLSISLAFHGLYQLSPTPTNTPGLSPRTSPHVWFKSSPLCSQSPLAVAESKRAPPPPPLPTSLYLAFQVLVLGRVHFMLRLCNCPFVLRVEGFNFKGELLDVQIKTRCKH